MRADPRGRREAKLAGIALAALLCTLPSYVTAASVRIANLSDVNFGTLDPSNDARNSQDVCIFSDTFFNGYRITARGSGFASAFTLSAGVSQPLLAYQVEWSDAARDNTGTRLSPGVARGGFHTNGLDSTCSLGLFENASLIIILRSNDLAGAAANVQYSGMLTLTVAPE
jgi:hypothetical protein